MSLQSAWLRKFASICLAGCWLHAQPSLAGPLGGIVGLPGQVLGGVGQTTGQIGGDLNTTLGAMQRDLVGRPNAVRTFDRDPNGARVLRRTVIAIAPSQSDLSVAKQLNFEVVRSYDLSS